jgi:hypothetical protein
MRKLVNCILLGSTLLAVLTAALWLRSGTIYETVYVRTGAWFWQASSVKGSITVCRYRGWPSPPAYRHEIVDHNPLKGVGPVFAVQFAGASRSEWKCGPAEGEYGTTRVAVGPDGFVQWNTPAVPILQSTFRARFSPLMRFWSVTLCYWAILGTLLLPLAGQGIASILIWMAGRSRRARGLCPKCGYDLRESPFQCPECGRHVAGASPSRS